jgi:hypothetical protein
MENFSLKKIIKNHSIAMILCCAIPLTLIAVLSMTGILGSWGYYAIFLLCPLLHVFMMRGHNHHSTDRDEPLMIQAGEEKEKERQEGSL